MHALRESVYQANMELHRRGVALYTWGNASQIDRARGIVAIKPSGVAYEVLTPDQIVLLSIEDGRAVEPGLRPSSDAPTHLALYRAFDSIGGVVHTHSAYATAWAQAGRAIPPLGTTHADYFRGEVPVTRFLTREEIECDYEYATGELIADTFAGRNPLHTPGVLVRGHGPFTWGADAAEAVYHAVVLEEVARMAHLTFALAPSTAELPGEISDKHFSRKHGPQAYYGQK